MGNTLATMFTMTTYGTWLRGDRRGWVDDGIIFPPNPILEDADRRRMKHSPYLFDCDRLHEAGGYIGESLTTRLEFPLYALCINTWHVHFVIGPTCHTLGDVAKCAKDAVRYGLGPGRPIWAEGYDKRFCFDNRSARNRIRYVERHNERYGWPAKPWSFISEYHPPTT